MITKPCPSCGVPRRVETLDDGVTPVGFWPCPNDYCDPVANTRQETTASVGRVVILSLFLVCSVVMAYIVISLERSEEQWMQIECEERGGQWLPVRRRLGLPTGEGVCEPRDP